MGCFLEQASGGKILLVPGPGGGQLQILSFLRITCVLGQQGPQGSHVINGKTETPEKQFAQITLLVTSLSKYYLLLLNMY